RTIFALDGQIDYELVPTAGGDVTTDYAYDSQGRVNEVDHFVDSNGNHVFNSGVGGETLLSGSTYSYNLDDTRSGETDSYYDGTAQATKSSTIAWLYDGEGRLIQENFEGVDGLGNPLKYQDTFAYDFCGNRIQEDHDDQTLDLPGGSNPGSAGPDSTTYSTYDGNDRLIKQTKGPADDTFTTF